MLLLLLLLLLLSRSLLFLAIGWQANGCNALSPLLCGMAFDYACTEGIGRAVRNPAYLSIHRKLTASCLTPSPPSTTHHPPSAIRHPPSTPPSIIPPFLFSVWPCLPRRRSSPPQLQPSCTRHVPGGGKERIYSAYRLAHPNAYAPQNAHIYALHYRQQQHHPGSRSWRVSTIQPALAAL